MAQLSQQTIDVDEAVTGALDVGLSYQDSGKLIITLHSKLQGCTASAHLGQQTQVVQASSTSPYQARGHVGHRKWGWDGPNPNPTRQQLE